MLGYANPGLVPGHGLVAPGTFRTQDLGRLDTRGRLQVVGRGDDVLISGGVNVHPAQVEDLLSGCPGIREVAVTGYPDPVWGTCLVALYLGESDVVAVEAWAKEHLPNQIRPRVFKKINEMPRTQLGKIRRRDLNRLLDDT
jgi:O-succinylbenzoic acid--CoA ligase